MLPVDLSWIAFIMLRYVSSTPTLMRVFIINRCWILSNAFSVSIGMIMWFLPFLLLMQCITLMELQILNHPYIFGINPTSSWYMILFTYCWIWFDNVLLKIFAFIFIGDIGCNFLFICSVFVWLQDQRMVALLNEFLQFFGIVWEGRVKVIKRY